MLNSQKLQSCPYCFILLYTTNLCSLGGQKVNRYRQIQADTIRSKATLNSVFRSPNTKIYEVLATVQNQSFFGIEPCFLSPPNKKTSHQWWEDNKTKPVKDRQSIVTPSLAQKRSDLFKTNEHSDLRLDRLRQWLLLGIFTRISSFVSFARVYHVLNDLSIT